MNDDISKVPGIRDDQDARAPEIELSPFGMSVLVERLEPSSGKRPGRPTDPSWEKTGKLPMSDATANALRRLAEKFSTPRRRISPMQVAAYLLEEEVHAYRDVFDFLDHTEPRLQTVWDTPTTTRDEKVHAYEREWAIIEYKDPAAIKEPFLWEASNEACLTTSILHAGVLDDYGHVVIRGDLLGREKKDQLRELAESRGGIVFHETMQAFRESRPSPLSPYPVLLKHFGDRRIHRFRYPLRVVHEPYLYHLAKRFGVTFNVFHAAVIGSHGYLDVELRPLDKADQLVAFARRLGVNVRWVDPDNFWDDLTLDSEEEIRRSLVAVRGKGEDWQSLPPESDSAVAKILERFKAEYELFPGHYFIGKWLYRETENAGVTTPPAVTRMRTPLQEALWRLIENSEFIGRPARARIQSPLQAAVLWNSAKVLHNAGGEDSPWGEVAEAA
jgi:hypothetical protein